MDKNLLNKDFVMKSGVFHRPSQAISKEEYQNKEKRQKWHRIINTALSLCVIYMFSQTIPDIYDELSGLAEERVDKVEIAQIVEDEGYRSKPYKDSLGKWTVGFGHLVKKGESFDDLTPQKAIKMLRKDYEYAKMSVSEQYPWAVGEVRLVLVNMTYQMGEKGVSNFKDTLLHLETGEWDLAAGEMLDSVWAKQTPNRAARLASRIMALEG